MKTKRDKKEEMIEKEVKKDLVGKDVEAERKPFLVFEVEKAQEMVTFLENVPYKYSKPIIDVLMSLKPYKG